uniref:Uncharacterized protein n=1 Tax=Oryza sativa subsp. japonica TaxID=39947 RepID=Q653T5_ORYSJ|nr:hypothetical protein [Oryza sativa Japonica Group]BAD45932.1 hypothetical protein [Oryza sativa Japonica Group]
MARCLFTFLPPLPRPLPPPRWRQPGLRSDPKRQGEEDPWQIFTAADGPAHCQELIRVLQCRDPQRVAQI